MRLQFRIQPFQTEAVRSVAECFIGQLLSEGSGYRANPGNESGLLEEQGWKNADISISEERLLENIRAVQKEQGLAMSKKLAESAGCRCNLDVEMETGTGKTYCYIKTIFELQKKYGWSKFIIVVPSIAIREGVLKTFQITEDHFAATYGKKARYFIYNSRELNNLESFSADSGINVMIINIQAFNATGADNRRIYEEQDNFQSRKPIDVISANRPILILDEPQKMEGDKTLEALKKFRPLMILRYSATHRTKHDKIHILDAVDAINKKLVKKIAVRGISVRGTGGTAPYLFLDVIKKFDDKPPVARMEMEVSRTNGIPSRKIRTLKHGDNLFELSGQLEQYKGYTVADIDTFADTTAFTNGIVIGRGETIGDVAEEALRQIQIRETIKAHLEKEKRLFYKGIKVLSLFFIDSVKKYRDYDQSDEKGEYAHVFEEEYARIVKEHMDDLGAGDEALKEYWQRDAAATVHEGYFSIDKKSKRLVDPTVKKRGEEAGLSDDVSAYDLILKDKERLLSHTEPVRFIFSHSALREGWDNPNVFGMCMLKHAESGISRRQEIGRGLRLCVNQNGERIDGHDDNILTVVTDESFAEYAKGLQSEIAATLSKKPPQVDAAYFKGKTLPTETGEQRPITDMMANKIEIWLIKNDYTDDSKAVTEAYHQARRDGALAPLPPELAEFDERIFSIVDDVGKGAQASQPEDDYAKKQIRLKRDKFVEFKALWNKINRKAVYSVHFESDELVKNCIAAIDKELKITGALYTVESGLQQSDITAEQLRRGDAFTDEGRTTAKLEGSARSRTRYDLTGKIAGNTTLTRRTIAAILTGIKPTLFAQFAHNPEQFIAEASRLINEQKATIVIERLSYDAIAETFEANIFTDAERNVSKSSIRETPNRHIYDAVATQSKIEMDFVDELDKSSEVTVYAKLPNGFFIPTPVGDYNPDWAIVFRDKDVKHIYFVAETKGDISTMQFRKIEDSKIECARKFFGRLNEISTQKDRVTYDVVDNYARLEEIVQTLKTQEQA
ncbi:MAG: DEAD/DEAH box helicase family protein [Betaproteobacteria bacterium]|nr:DEAD/DEAH box helicase family protein [Betaproteobacteria bacterium]